MRTENLREKQIIDNCTGNAAGKVWALEAMSCLYPDGFVSPCFQWLMGHVAGARVLRKELRSGDLTKALGI